jgi:hypothetical protein
MLSFAYDEGRFKEILAMSDIFREVNEALQRERAAALWKEYGPTLILAAIILVLSTAATSFYRHWDSGRDREETAKLITAMNSDDMAGALQSAATNSRGAHRAVAILIAGHKAAEDKDFAAAAAQYKSVADDSGAPGDLRDLAAILQSRAELLAAKDLAPDFKSIALRLETVANDKNSPFAAQAALEAATLYGEKLNDVGKAHAMLEIITAEQSDSVAEKAQALRRLYATTPQASEQSKGQ